MRRIPLTEGAERLGVHGLQSRALRRNPHPKTVREFSVTSDVSLATYIQGSCMGADGDLMGM